MLIPKHAEFFCAKTFHGSSLASSAFAKAGAGLGCTIMACLGWPSRCSIKMGAFLNRSLTRPSMNALKLPDYATQPDGLMLCESSSITIVTEKACGGYGSLR